MDPSNAMSPDLETLLDRSGWVNRLARSLVADPHAADDLVQEAWIVALQRGPEGVDRPGLERWLSAVVRNLARDRRRGERRRRARELDAGERDAEAGALDGAAMLDQLDAHRRVVEAVRSLDEPYRTAILMRYFDGATPTRIARRLGVPVRTVHSRLHRGLSKLRERLGRDFEGDRGAWMLALAPLCERSRWTTGANRSTGASWAHGARLATGSLSGALVMDAKLKVSLAVAALVGVAAVATFSSARVVPEAGPAQVARASEPAELAVVEGAGPDALPGDVARAAVDVEPARPELAPETEPVAAPPEVLSGRVLSVSGRPLAGVRVGVRPVGSDPALTLPDGAITRSGPDGTFTLPRAHEAQGGGTYGEIEVLDDDLTPVLQPTTHFGGTSEAEELVLVVAPRQPLAGIVVDTQGNRLAGATLTVDVARSFHARFDERLERSRVVRWIETTDEEGRFDLPEAPRLDDGLLVTRCPGFAPDIRSLPSTPDASLEIVLGAPRTDAGLLEGAVLDLDGRPVEGAHVALEFASGKTDSEGRFALRLKGPGKRGVLMALKPGSLPARLESATESNLDPEAWPQPLVLRLGGAPLSIEGRVVDVDGEPVPGARVWTSDLTHFGAVQAPEFGAMTTVAADVESLLRDGGRREDVRTDDDGFFALDGLIDRDYRISVHDEEEVAFLQSEPVRAGAAGLVLTLPREERVPRVAGRVVGTDGKPVAAVSVALCRIVSVRNGYADDISTPAVQTDEEGRFAFVDVPRSLDHARIFGDGIDFADNRNPIPEGSDLEELELVVTRRCQLRIELDDADEADSFQVLDAEGDVSMLTVLRGNVAWTTDRGRLVDGRSESINASERVTTLVLFRGSEEVRRVPLRLGHDGVNVIRP